MEVTYKCRLLGLSLLHLLWPTLLTCSGCTSVPATLGSVQTLKKRCRVMFMECLSELINKEVTTDKLGLTQFK